ncbi:MAG TPA: ATP-binding protein [bacterium]|nr:ATP-binding protein [bacterium]
MAADRLETDAKTAPAEGARRSLSIRAKLMGVMLVVFLIPIAPMLYLLNMRLQTSFDNIDRGRVTSALDGIRNEHRALVENTKDRVETLANDRFLIEDVATYSMWPNVLIRRVEAMRKTSGLDILMVADAEYRLIADGANPARFDIEARSFADDAFVRDALENGTVGVTLRRDEQSGAVSVMIYHPIRYLGVNDAVLIGGTRVGQEYVDRLHRLASARVVLYEGNKATLSSEEGDTELSLPVGDEFLEQLDAEPETTKRVHVGRSDFTVGGVPLTDPDTGRGMGYLVIGVSRDTVNGIVAQTRRDILYVMLLGLGVSMALAVIMSVGITRPIEKLVRSARLIGSGQFDVAETPVMSGDEIGLLARTMNKMAFDLRDYSIRLALTERTAAWREVARRIAHEIKNPLSPIQLSIENLKAVFEENREMFDEMFPESSDMILEEVDKLRRLANEFSEFAQMPEPVFERVDAAEMLHNLVKFHSSTAPAGVKLNIIGCDKAIVIRADRDQLNRVFTNLIKNAVEAMPDGGDLTVSAVKTDGGAVFRFRDTGVGMTAEQLERIFTPYFTSKSGGTGLGLSIARRILADHGARIEASGAPGKGAEFAVTFGDQTAAETGGSGLER